MRSTGEVMGIDADFGRAFAKAQEGAGTRLPRSGAVFITLRDADKPGIVDSAKRLVELGFELYSTEGTAATLRAAGIPVTSVAKLGEGSPHVVDLVDDGKVDLVFNTPGARDRYRADGNEIREATVRHNVPCITTLAGAVAATEGIVASTKEPLSVRALQEYHE
jgi:carbamoyl-phosphate synthase large subunit